MIARGLRAVLCFMLWCGIASLALGQASAGIQGRVTDPTDAVIPRAAVTVTDAGGVTRSAVTDGQGRYGIDRLAPGSYTIRVESPGFAVYESAGNTLAAGASHRIDVKMAVEKNNESVNVAVGGTNAVDVDPSQNAGQLLLRGSDLDSLSDDPEDLANELQMLAGPAAGPNGPQIFIDGFTDGIMPPKASIREIHVNQNPFAAEFDRVGFGRVEIFTKPGSDKFHGQASMDFGNRALTARNPYLIGPIVPDYRQEIYAGNLSGPLSKRASFFVDGQGRVTDENAVLNYTQLDGGLNPQAVSTVLVTPSRRYSFAPRLDYGLTPNHTLIVRYSLAGIMAQNQGLNPQLFDQASQAYSTDEVDQNVQVSESSVLGASVLNNARFQFYSNHLSQRGVSSAPELDVQGAFTAGGSFPLNYTDRDRYELQNYTTVVHGQHTIEFGLRWRGDWLREDSTANFNGRYIFSSSSSGNSAGLTALEVYQQNQRLAAQGVSQADIAAQGFGPTQFLLTTGQALVGVSQSDGGIFVQDDWRARPNLTISGGLRYEIQNHVADYSNVAPRAAISWAPSTHGWLANTVLRAGSGIFYDRFTSDLIWNATRQDGAHQTQYIVRNPAFYPEIPDPAALAGQASTKATYQFDPAMRVPRMVQTAVSLERNFAHNTSLAVTYTNSRGWHELRTLDINAPTASSVDSQGKAVGPRPYGDAAGDIYRYQAGGVFRQNQLIVTVHSTINSRLSFFGYYVYGRAMNNTDSAASLPSNPYDLEAEYGRAAFDFRQRGFVSGNIALPLRVQMSSFAFLQSGMPYNMTSGVDTNNDGNPNDDRPAFAQNLARPSVVTKAGFGSFDTSPLSLANAVIVPRNSLGGPGILSLTTRISRTWSFGRAGKGVGVAGGDEIRGGDSIRNGGLGGGSNQAGMAGVFGGTATRRPYNLTFSASFRNWLNNVNPAAPIGNLSSSYFGRSLALNTFGPLPGAGPNAGAGNRHIELQVKFGF
ncbi:hypothetical protein FTO74_09335 [Granulicella sp. WH15]|nr:hypothetical protein FTO74_09335 [Granulicella sp. WH15]